MFVSSRNPMVYRSTGSAGRSSSGGKSSSSDGSVARIAKSDLGGAGSIISRCPSLRIMASSPGNSKSRGIRTAWFRPFLNSLTCRSVINEIHSEKSQAAYAKAYALPKCVCQRQIAQQTCSFSPLNPFSPLDLEFPIRTYDEHLSASVHGGQRNMSQQENAPRVNGGVTRVNGGVK